MNRYFSNSVNLEVTAFDRATEIFVVDAGLRRIGKGIGEVSLNVKPGIYKVRFRAGSTVREEFVSVRPDDSNVHVSAPPVNFRSAAPLVETETTHEYHAGPAGHASRKVHGRDGRGSQIFVFAREEDRSEPPLSPSSVSVYDLAGRMIASLDQGDVDSRSTCAGLNLEVDPGTYRVRIETGSVGDYELFVTTTEDWQTQVFLVTETFGPPDDSVRRPSLRLASMLMARKGIGFDHGNPGARLAELARLGLANHRAVIAGTDLERMLTGKFEDPLLGVYAGHLLTLRRKPDWRLFDIVCKNVLRLLGDHPDARALALIREHPGASRRPAFEAPPTLRRSWETIIRAAKKRPSLLPSQGPLSGLARNILYTSTWLLHRVQPNEGMGAPLHESTIASEEVARELMRVGWQDLSDRVDRAREGGARFTELERSIISTVLSTPRWEEEEGLGAGDEEIDTRRMMERIVAPPDAVRTSLGALQAKLDLQGTDAVQ